MLKPLWTTLVISMALSSPSLAIDQTLNLLDFEQRIDDGDIVFVPYKNTTPDRGYAWFREYQMDYREPTVGGAAVKTLHISLVPTATITNRFKDFTDQHKVIAERKTLIPDNAVLCQPNQALTDLLATFPMSRTKVLPQAYPKLCTLMIRYAASQTQQQQLVDLLKLGDSVTASFSIQMSNGPTDRYIVDVPQIISDLRQLKILTSYASDSSNEYGWQGNKEQIGFYSARMPETLYGLSNQTTDVATLFNHWQKWMALFSLDAATQSVRITEADAANPLEILTGGTPVVTQLDVNHP